jgi:dTDP-4-dehydrorhamnose 3,5-epimerase
MGREVRATDSRGAGAAVKFMPTSLGDAYIIELERLEDERGFFARTFCQDEFAAHGLKSLFVQCNVSFNEKRGTLRGMHYQDKPHEEAKLVRCTRGAVFDVIIDIRRESSTYKQWIGVELTADNRRMLYIPEGFAHGFQTLEDGSEMFYQMSEMYRPELARGIRWNDPAFAIRWPLPSPIISARDAGYRDFIS